MAKVIPISILKSISGKTSKSDSTYMRTNKRTGINYAVKLTKSTYRNTETQQKLRSAFGENARLASRWLRTNGPSSDQPEGTESYRAVKYAFLRQHRYGSLYIFVRANIREDGTVRVSQQTEV